MNYEIHLIILTLYCCPLILATRGTYRPIIGILAQEQDAPANNSYIPSSYVKAVESSGARVVPIFINESLQYYQEMMAALNGIVLPGGNVNLTATTGFARSANIVFDIATQINDQGDHFPLLGVCQGMQKLAILTNDNKNLLRACPGMRNIALALRFKPGYRRASLYATASRRNLITLTSWNSTANHHQWCVTEKITALGLEKYWRVLSINTDGEHKEFISSMQAYKYPYVGVQFHPEKVSFEWSITQNNPHSMLAIKANRLFYDWLVQEARQNKHHFNDSKKEKSALIYNYQQVYTGSEGDFEQQYVF
ncbi:LOW QUALITY PROTEIN: gamma-glutamyl hydrolase-like [Rhodnius prolixus]|uniref:LOW QUALITY PROTEIN: gamma-glutamyl hydrolase-like n=1 Tax=Rhodnius prolixus TaxID=13249 RepID=UPI003D18DD64